MLLLGAAWLGGSSLQSEVVIAAAPNLMAPAGRHHMTASRLFPRSVFDRAVQDHKPLRHTRGFTCLAHIVASDAHDPERRHPRLDDARRLCAGKRRPPLGTPGSPSRGRNDGSGCGVGMTAVTGAPG
jgi:hypothetical protein